MRERIGPYRVERVLGTSAFATVYLAHDEELVAPIAIEVLAEDWTSDEEVRRRFTEEARLLWRAASDHIVRVHTIGELEDGRPYFAMDHADRGSLAERMAERASEGTPYSVNEAVGTSIGIAAGLTVAHSLGIVHRDLEPSNVLYQSTGEHDGDGADERPVLAAFGAARSLARSRGTIAPGAPHYMAPEQADGRADERSDLYSAAVILYELLAGRVPYPYESASEVLSAQQHEPPASISSIRDDVPESIDDLLAGALSPSPVLRPPSALAWIAALRTAISGEPGAVRRSIPPPLPPPLPPPSTEPSTAPSATPGPAPAAVVRADEGAPPDGGTSPGGAPPPDYVAPPGPPRKRRRAAIAAIAALVLVGLVVGIAVAITAGGDPASAEELVAEPLSSLGVHPFGPDVASSNELLPKSSTIPALPTNLPPPGQVTSIAGSSPRLYGGSNELSVCNVKKLVAFLEANPDKAAAWASVVDVPVGGIPDYVAELTDVVLQRDTHVTNHGYVDGAADPSQSILQTGTAVLVDRFGVPKVRCKGSTPLAAPAPVRGTPTYAGTAWRDFDPTEIVVVTAQQAVDSFVLVDLRTGGELERSPGRRPTTAAPEPTELTVFGKASAGSEYSSEFPASAAVDGDLATSWFSAGDAESRSSEYRWDSPNEVLITEVDVVSNEGNPDFRTDHGFEKVTVSVYDGSGAVAFRQEVPLPGTPDPDVHVEPDVRGMAVELRFEGPEATDRSGFAELRVYGTS